VAAAAEAALQRYVPDFVADAPQVIYSVSALGARRPSRWL
jgi:hypothetical protein